MVKQVYGSYLLLTIFLSFFIIFGNEGFAYQEHKPLEYEISINAINIPVFAVDNKGNPVFDLKQEEIELKVNQQPFDISAFNAFHVEEHKRVNGKKEILNPDARINFLIFDSISNSKKGLKRAKEIALGIIKESPSTDAFIILESRPKTGFRYIIGPETDREKLTEVINTVSKFAEQQFFSLGKHFKEMGGNNVLSSGSPTSQGNANISGGSHSWEYRAKIFENAIRNAQTDRAEYYEDLKIFFNTISQMKYALKTITQPKHVFLISGGIPSSALGKEVVRYYKFIGDAAKAINYGGSVLYIINPIPLPDNSTSHSIKLMAKECGGKYFGGNNVKEIVDNVKKSTQAYYELVFIPDRNKEKLQVELTCKRDGVTLHSVNFAEKGKPYKEMESLQKKLFALSVITGGSWSRIIGDVKEIKFKKVKTQKDGTKSKRIIVNLPDEMKNRRLDIFVLNLESNTMKANIGLSNQLVNTELEVDLVVEKEKTQYFVIVDPIRTVCFYNQVN